jgi:hypothetical protein
VLSFEEYRFEANGIDDMRVLVCGGRAYHDQSKVDDVLDTLDWQRSVKAILQGGATGADELARNWADRRRIKVRTYIAGKKSTGRASWSKGNQRMITEGKPDLVVAFPGVQRTADLVGRAKAAGVMVLLIDGASDDPILLDGLRWSA